MRSNAYSDSKRFNTAHLSCNWFYTGKRLFICSRVDIWTAIRLDAQGIGNYKQIVATFTEIYLPLSVLWVFAVFLLLKEKEWPFLLIALQPFFMIVDRKS